MSGTAPPRGTMRAAAVLMVGRTAGFAIAFAIPLVLVRVLDQRAFGTYKYLFMVATTLNVLQLGMAESLYYFVPRRAQAPGPVLLHAVLTLAAIGAAIVGAMTAGREPIAAMLGERAIARYLPLLSVFVGLSLVALPLEIVMVSRKTYRGAAATYAASDLARAALLIGPALATGRLSAVLWGAVIFAAARVAALTVYLARTVGAALSFEAEQWRAQVAYACPFAVAVIIETLQVNLHQYIVWAKFDPATFAIYAAGCLQIPLVDVLTTSVGNVMMVRMVDDVGRPAAALALWHQAVDRLAFWLWPLTAALVITAHDVIVLLFTGRYAASVPIFMVSTFAIALAAFQVDSVLRVYAQTRFLIVMNLIRLAVVVAGISWAISTFSLIGAIGITVIGMAVAKAVALWRMTAIFGVSMREVLPWRGLGRTLALVAVTSGIVIAIRPAVAAVEASPLRHGAALAVIYGAIYVSIDWILGARGLRVGTLKPGPADS